MGLAHQRRFGLQMLLYMSIRAGNEIAITVLYNAAGHVLSSQLGRERPRSLESSEIFLRDKMDGEATYACLFLSFFFLSYLIFALAKVLL